MAQIYTRDESGAIVEFPTVRPLESAPATATLQSPQHTPLPTLTPAQEERIITDAQRRLDEAGEAAGKLAEEARGKVNDLRNDPATAERLRGALSYVTGENGVVERIQRFWKEVGEEAGSLKDQVEQGTAPATPENALGARRLMELGNQAQQGLSALKEKVSSATGSQEQELEAIKNQYESWSDIALGYGRATVISGATIAGGTLLAAGTLKIAALGAAIGVGTAGLLNAGAQGYKVASGEKSLGAGISDGWDQFTTDLGTVASSVPSGLAMSALRTVALKSGASAVGQGMLAKTLSWFAPTHIAASAAMGAVPIIAETSKNILLEHRSIPEASELGTAIADINAEYRREAAAKKEGKGILGSALEAARGLAFGEYRKDDYIPFATSKLSEYKIPNGAKHVDAGFRLLEASEKEVFGYAQKFHNLNTPVSRFGVDWNAIAQNSKWDFYNGTASNWVGIKAGVGYGAVASSGNNILLRGAQDLRILVKQTLATSGLSAGLWALEGDLSVKRAAEIVSKNAIGNLTGTLIGKGKVSP